MAEFLTKLIVFAKFEISVNIYPVTSLFEEQKSFSATPLL